jgi:DNA-directed RNA polymerase specialized sigma24 family protein
MIDDWELAIHQRLLNRDVTAPAELAERYLLHLIKNVSSAYPKVDDPHLCSDACEDAILKYIKEPGKFDPEKLGLLAYLKMSAVGDLKNEFEKRDRRRRHESTEEDVEEKRVLRNEGREGFGSPQFIIIQNESELHQEQLLEQWFPDPTDRQLARMVLDQERDTKLYVEVLGIESESIDEQRNIVKRHKDRIKKRLKDLNHG